VKLIGNGSMSEVKQLVTMPFVFSTPKGDAELVGDQRVANASIASPST
jgi:hypothetical protein